MVNCGGRNSIEDVSEYIEEPVINEKDKPVYLREGVDTGTFPMWARILVYVFVIVLFLKIMALVKYIIEKIK